MYINITVSRKEAAKSIEIVGVNELGNYAIKRRRAANSWGSELKIIHVWSRVNTRRNRGPKENSSGVHTASGRQASGRGSVFGAPLLVPSRYEEEAHY